MKKLSILFVLLTAFIFAGCSDDDKDFAISFEGKLTDANSEFTTTGGTAGDHGYYYTSFKDPSNTIEFTHSYSSSGFGGGFTYSNYTDVTTPGLGNISAITGKGKYGTTYMTAYTGWTAEMALLQPEKYKFKGVWVTNSTYAYIAIKDGNDGYYGDTDFEDGDWFKLTAIGYDSEDKVINSVDFYLADFRNGKTNIVNTWQWFDFSRISSAEYIVFELSSTDNDNWGMRTPAYFCIDGITLEEK